MTFTATEFYVFLPVMYLLYWGLKGRTREQNWLLLVGSYVFYGWWDVRFLVLLFVSSLVDFLIGKALPAYQNTAKARYLLYLSLAVNLGILGFFKYYDFFVLSFQEAFASVGVHLNMRTLNVILPVGISFYTFQTLSYTIDIYRGRLRPTHNFVDFFAYVSFFPQLVAGPIERASSLLPQFEKTRVQDPEMTVDGLRQMLWGFFKKIVIADNVGLQVDHIFAHYTELSSIQLLLGASLFFVQIYADFSGYSDIALGLGKLFGFRLMTNFRMPMFSISIPDFWSKWHISMTTWFRDYLYVPLARSIGKTPGRRFLSTLILFMVIGLWHGANWTFVAFGFINGLFFLPTFFFKKKTKPKIGGLEGRWAQSVQFWSLVFLAFFITSLNSIFFRAPDLATAVGYFVHLFYDVSLAMPEAASLNAWFFYAVPFLAFEWINRGKSHQLDIGHYPTWLRFSVYYVLALMIFFLGNFSERPFIYFQF